VTERSYLSIREVLDLLVAEFPDVTISKIRFLESRGLIHPERTPSGYRKFYGADVERLRWILRQQREHFLPLKVIKGRLEAANGGPQETTVEASLFDDAYADDEPPVDPTRLVGVGAMAGGEAAANTGLRLMAGTASGRQVVGSPRPTRDGDAGSRGERAAIPLARVSGGGGGEPAAAFERPWPPAVSHAAPRVNAPAVADERPRAETAATRETALADVPHSVAPDRSPGRLAERATNEPTPARPTSPAPVPAVGLAPAEAAGLSSADTRESSVAPAASGSARPGRGAGRPRKAPSASEQGGESPATGSPAAESPATESPATASPATGSPTGREPAEPSAGHAGAALPSAAPIGQADLASGMSFSADELAGAAGVEAAVVAELEEYGLVVGRVIAGVRCYDEEALVVTRIAAGFRVFGIESRHLRTFKHAAEREAGLFSQVVTPLLRQRNPAARERAQASLTELASLGAQIQAALLRAELRDLTGG
jgi:DNA-binding transcriptional MerR regulator